MPAPPLQIFYPLGGTQASQMYIWDGSKPIPWDGSVTVSVTTSGSAINDGVTSTIKATVVDYLNSASVPAKANPVAVLLVDTTGAPYNASGGGTQNVLVVNTTGTAVPISSTTLATLAEQQTQTGYLNTLQGIVSSARAAVNLIPGSAGVQGGSGAVSSTTQRVTLATDVALPTGTNSIGQVTANAGTNLNTSALAVESGGNLATLAGIVSSARAAVNLIPGSAGVAGGSGAVSSTTQRVTLATDVALPAGNNNIGDVDVVTIPGIVGTIADDATTPGNPVMTGGQAKSPDGTDPGNVSNEDDVVRFIADLNRIPFINPDDPTKTHISFNNTSAYTDQQIAAAPGSGKRTVITRIRFSSGTAAAINLFLEEGSTKIAGPYYLEAIAGRGLAFDTYIPVTANTAVTFTTSANNSQTIEFEYITKKV